MSTYIIHGTKPVYSKYQSWIKLTFKLAHIRHPFLTILKSVQYWLFLSLKCRSDIFKWECFYFKCSM
jgi:hypothetical protein